MKANVRINQLETRWITKIFKLSISKSISICLRLISNTIDLNFYDKLKFIKRIINLIYIYITSSSILILYLRVNSNPSLIVLV